MRRKLGLGRILRLLFGLEVACQSLGTPFQPTSGWPTIHPEPRLSLPTTPFELAHADRARMTSYLVVMGICGRTSYL